MSDFDPAVLLDSEIRRLSVKPNMTAKDCRLVMAYGAAIEALSRTPQPVTPAGGEVVAYRYVADEGVYNPFVRDWLDGSPDQLDLENIARHPGVRFEFAYSNPPVPDHELQQKWFRRGWDMYVEIHGETHPPAADAALVAALERFVKDADEVDLGGGDAVVTTCESLELAKAALNQRGG